MRNVFSADPVNIEVNVMKCNGLCQQLHEKVNGAHLQQPLLDGQGYQLQCDVRTQFFDLVVAWSNDLGGLEMTKGTFTIGGFRRRAFNFVANKMHHGRRLSCSGSHSVVWEANNNRSVVLSVYYGPNSLSVASDLGTVDNSAKTIGVHYGSTYRVSCTTNEVNQEAVTKFGFLFENGSMALSNNSANLFGLGAVYPIVGTGVLNGGTVYTSTISFVADLSIHDQSLRCKSFNKDNTGFEVELSFKVQILSRVVDLSLTVVNEAGKVFYERSKSSSLSKPLTTEEAYTAICRFRTDIPLAQLRWVLANGWKGVNIDHQNQTVLFDGGTRVYAYEKRFNVKAADKLNDLELKCEAQHDIVMEIQSEVTFTQEVIFGPRALEFTASGGALDATNEMFGINYGTTYTLICSTDNVNNEADIVYTLTPAPQNSIQIVNSAVDDKFGGKNFKAAMTFNATVEMHHVNVSCKSHNVDQSKYQQLRRLDLYLLEGKPPEIEISLQKESNRDPHISLKQRLWKPLDYGTVYIIICSTVVNLPDVRLRWSTTFGETATKNLASDDTYSTTFTFTATEKQNQQTIVCTASHDTVRELSAARNVTLDVTFGPTQITFSVDGGDAKFERRAAGSGVSLLLLTNIIYTIHCITDSFNDQVDLDFFGDLSKVRPSRQSNETANGGRTLKISTSFDADTVHGFRFYCSSANQRNRQFHARTTTYTAHVSKGPYSLKIIQKGGYFEKNSHFTSFKQGSIYTIQCTTDLVVEIVNMTFKIGHINGNEPVKTADKKFVSTIEDFEASADWFVTNLTCLAFNVHAKLFRVVEERYVYSIGNSLTLAFNADGIDLDPALSLHTVVSGDRVVITCWTTTPANHVIVNVTQSMQGLISAVNHTWMGSYPWYNHSRTLTFHEVTPAHDLMTINCTASHPQFTADRRTDLTKMLIIRVRYGPSELTLEAKDGIILNQTKDTVVLLSDEHYVLHCRTDTVYTTAMVTLEVAGNRTTLAEKFALPNSRFKFSTGNIAFHTNWQINGTFAVCFGQNEDAQKLSQIRRRMIIFEVGWTQWVDMPCSKTCGDGVYYRLRNCRRPNMADVYCPGSHILFRACVNYLPCEEVTYMKDATYLQYHEINHQEATNVQYAVVIGIVISGLSLYIWYSRIIYKRDVDDVLQTCYDDFDGVVNTMIRTLSHSDLFEDLGPEEKSDYCRQLITRKIHEMHDVQCIEVGTEFDWNLFIQQCQELSNEIVFAQNAETKRERQRKKMVVCQKMIAQRAKQQAVSMVQNKHTLTRNLLLLDVKAGDRERIKISLEEYKRFCVENNNLIEPDKELIRNTQKMLIALSIKPRLQNAVQSEDAEALRTIIQLSKETETQYLLAKELEVAEEHLQDLLERQEQRSELSVEVKLLREIKNCFNPPPVLHDVMAATLMILGQSERTVRNWRKCKTLFTAVSADETSGLFQRISDFKLDDLKIKTAKRVREILSGYDEIDVPENVMAFFHWSQQMIKECLVSASTAEPKQIETKQQATFSVRKVSADPKRRRGSKSASSYPSPSLYYKDDFSQKVKDKGTDNPPDQFLAVGKEPSDACLISLSRSWEPKDKKFVFPDQNWKGINNNWSCGRRVHPEKM